MDNIIEITNLDSLPKETLVIIKDTNDNVCLGIKSNSIDCSHIEFKAKIILMNNSSTYALMIKNGDSNIYKCLISLDNVNNKSTLYKLINLDRFNLIIFKDGNEQDIFRIENENKNTLNNMLLQGLVAQDGSSKISEDCLNKSFTIDKLWNE